MPVTLAQASLNAASAIDRRIIDEFRKSTYLLDKIPFTQSVNPDGGGSTLVYGYTRQITQRAAAFRAINAEYTPTEVTKQQYTVNLRPMGGSFQIDRVLADIGSAAVAETAFQMEQLIKATGAYFADQAINGDSAVTTDGFDGLSKALAGSSTEVNAGGPVLDLTAVDTKAEALATMRRLNAWLALLNGRPDAILGNADAISWFIAIASWADQIDKTTNSFGVPISAYNGIPLIDLGEKAGAADQIIPNYVGTNETQTITVEATSGNYRLTFAGQQTADIAEAATGANVETALLLLSNLDTGDVTVTGGAGGPHTATFAGRYAGINVPLMTGQDIDLAGGADTVVVTAGTAGGGGTGTGQLGLTDLYAVRFGQDAFHAVAVPGQLVKRWLPDFATAGAVKTGEVELGPAAVVLKATKGAAVFRNIKVA